MITIQDVIRQATGRLKSFGVSDTPYLDVLLLMGQALHLTKEQLLSRTTDTIWEEEAMLFGRLLSKRCSGTPVAYLVGSREFYGHSFYVDKRVLIPRPDTETLVEEALAKARTYHRDLRILDLCTGSGCVGISLAAELSEARVSLSDISGGALEVASLNSMNILSRKLKVIRSDLFEGITGTYELIVSNPPYLTEEECEDSQLKARGEPEGALLSGPDGLNHIRRILNDAIPHLASDGYLMLECGYSQAQAVADAMEKLGYREVRVIRDLGEHDRVVEGRRP